MIMKLVLASIAIALLSACQTTSSPTAPAQGTVTPRIQIEPTLHGRSAEEIVQSGEAVRLPANYSKDNYRQIRVAASFFPQDPDSPGQFAKEQTETVAAWLESELVKLRRFDILARSQLAELATAREISFQDQGTVSGNDLLRLGRQQGADYAFTAGMIINREIFDRVREQELIFTTIITFQLIDLESGSIVEADSVEGRSRRTFFQMPSGMIVGGFNPNNQEMVDEALREASMNALKVIANRLGYRLPVGGPVIGIRGEQFQVGAGREQGLMGDQVVVLYTNDMGVDVALARGEITPSQQQSPGRIFQWSDDPSVADLVEQLRTDPRGFLLDYELFAVSDGMPLPPEWEQAYQD